MCNITINCSCNDTCEVSESEPTIISQDHSTDGLTLGGDNKGQYEITIPDGYNFLAIGTHVVRSATGSNGYLVETNGPVPGYPEGGGATTLVWRFPDEALGTSATFNITALVVTFYKIGLLT